MLRWVLPLAVALMAHGLSIGGDFVGDDVPDIVEHPVVGGGEPLTHLFDYNVMGAPRGEGVNTMRPLATLMFALEWRLAGPRPAVFHALSLLWFLALVVAVQRTLRRLLGEGAAAAGAAIFAALAIHVDAVALVANCPEVCSLLFALLALGAALDGRAARACALYLVALLFKESAFLVPLVAAWWIAATDGPAALSPRSVLRKGRASSGDPRNRWQGGRRRRGLPPGEEDEAASGFEGFAGGARYVQRAPQRRGAAPLALALTAAAFLVARSLLLQVGVAGVIVPADNPLLLASAPARAWTPWVLLGNYLALTAAPVNLAFDHTYAAIPVGADLSRPAGWLGLGFAVLLLAIVALRVRRGAGAGRELRALAVAAGGFAASYALFSNSVFLIVTLFAERLFLFPSLFVALGLAAAGQWVAGLELSRAVRAAAAAGVALALAAQIALAAARTWQCRSEAALFASQVAACPDSVKGQLYQARTLARSGRPLEAVWHLGIAAAGRAAFPGPFEAPRLEHLPIADRLARLPALLAPGQPPDAFWPRFRGFVATSLGPGAAAALDRATVDL